MTHVDARRLLCPLPVIRLQEAIDTLQTGDCVEIICSDPGTLQDIPAWCRVHGHEVIETEKQDFAFRFVVKAVA